MTSWGTERSVPLVGGTITGARGGAESAAVMGFVATAAVAGGALHVAGSGPVDPLRTVISDYVMVPGGYALLALSQIKTPDPKGEAADARNARVTQAARQRGNEEFGAYVGEIERNAKIVRNPSVLE